MDPLKDLSLFMKISILTNLESILINQEIFKEDILLKLLDGELKMDKNIGYVPILGIHPGEIKDSLKS